MSRPKREPAEAEPTTSHAASRVAQWSWPLAALAVLLCAFLLAAFPARSDDLFMHLAVGRAWFEDGRFPNPDPWLASIPDYDRGWIDLAYWGTHLGVTALHRLGGFELVVLAKALLVVSGAAAPLWLAWRLGARSFLVPAAALLALWAASNRFIERGSLVSDCLGPWVLALVVLELEKPGRARWGVPVLLLVWTNLHPGVLVGLAFVLGAAVLRWREWRRWGPFALVCALACVAHPDGMRHLVWAVQSAPGGSGAFRRHNVEMMPTFAPMHAGSREVVQFVVLSAGVALTVAWSFVKGARPWWALGVLAALVLLGSSTVRYVTTASMALPVVLAGLAAVRTSPASGAGWLALHATTLAALASAATIAFSGYAPSSGERRVGFGLDRSAYPFGAAEFVRAHAIDGALFDEHSFGAFLAYEWNGHPKLHFHGYVLDEGFYERDYLGVNASAAEFTRIVERYDLGAFLLGRMPATPMSGPLVYRELLTRPEWRLVWWDDLAVLFVKDRPGNAPLIAESEFRYVDPFRTDRLNAGLKQDAERVKQECARQLRRVRNDRWARTIVEQVFKQTPAAFLRAQNEPRGSTR